ncbi:hypothetical protein C5C13_15130 [Clavibacter michiganensis]|jgi:protein-S-isoprenylcysteine O-methyltransferase Ste14|nr:hypothetical protein C5C13_15130 [Clavibacter michiganensis]
MVALDRERLRLASFSLVKHPRWALSAVGVVAVLVALVLALVLGLFSPPAANGVGAVPVDFAWRVAAIGFGYVAVALLLAELLLADRRATFRERAQAGDDVAALTRELPRPPKDEDHRTCWQKLADDRTTLLG